MGTVVCMTCQQVIWIKYEGLQSERTKAVEAGALPVSHKISDGRPEAEFIRCGGLPGDTRLGQAEPIPLIRKGDLVAAVRCLFNSGDEAERDSRGHEELLSGEPPIGATKEKIELTRQSPKGLEVEFPSLPALGNPLHVFHGAVVEIHRNEEIGAAYTISLLRGAAELEMEIAACGLNKAISKERVRGRLIVAIDLGYFRLQVVLEVSAKGVAAFENAASTALVKK